MMQIFVTTETGKSITLNVGEQFTIENVKWMLYGKKGMPVREQRLNFGTSEDMEDGRTLLSYNIQNLSTLCLLMFLDGGAGKPTKKEMLKKRVAELKGLSKKPLADLDLIESCKAANAVNSAHAKGDRLNFQAVLAEMSTEDIAELHDYIAHNNTHSEKKLDSMHELLGNGKLIGRAQAHFALTMGRFQELINDSVVMEFASEAGDLKIQDVLAEIKVHLRMRPEQSTKPMVTN